MTIVLAATTLALLTLLPASFSLSAELARPREADLKAAFLFNFIRFTEWPAEEMAKKTSPFVIGILGKDPFGTALDKTVEGETFQQKAIVIRRFARMDESVRDIQVLFIGSSEEGHLSAILKLIEDQPILTVSEIDSFAERGGIIKLKKENNRITFDVNVGAAKAAGLAMNAQLLRLAKIVKTQS